MWKVDRFAHPAVPLLLVHDEDGALVYVGLWAKVGGLVRFAKKHSARLEVDRAGRSEARSQLEQYLGGRRRAFKLRVRPLGSEFSVAVWEALPKIPYGKTISYGDQAEMLGAPKAVRAVGRANGANPIPLVLPCHRVIGASGDLTGFGGGMETKRWLLELERRRKVPAWTPRQTKPAQQLGLFA